MGPPRRSMTSSRMNPSQPHPTAAGSRAGERRAGRRIHVLTLVSSPEIAGGAEQLAARVAMGLDGARFRSTLCSTRRSDWPGLERELAAAGVQLIELDRRTRAD